MPMARGKRGRETVIQAVNAFRDRLNELDNEALARQQVEHFLKSWVTSEPRVRFLEEWIRLNKKQIASNAHTNGQDLGNGGRDGSEEPIRDRREMRSRGGREKPTRGGGEKPARGGGEMLTRGRRDVPTRGGKEKPARAPQQPRLSERQRPLGRRGGRPPDQPQESDHGQANQEDEDEETEDEEQVEEDNEAQESSDDESLDQEETEAEEQNEERESEAQEDGSLENEHSSDGEAEVTVPENGQSSDGEAEDRTLENGQSSDGEAEDGVPSNGRSSDGEAEDSRETPVEDRINQPHVHPGPRDQEAQLDQQRLSEERANELNKQHLSEISNRETSHSTQTTDPQANQQGLSSNLRVGDHPNYLNTPVRPLAIADMLRQDQQFTTTPGFTGPQRADNPIQSYDLRSLLQQQSLLSPPETQRREEDVRRMQPLLDAALVPNFHFKEPIRITSTFLDRPTLEHIKNQVVEASGFETFSRNKRVALVAFVGSFYDPASYWDLRESMCKVIQSGGYRLVKPEGDTDNELNGEDRRGSLSTTDGLQAPACLKDFVKTWRERLTFAQETSTASIRNTRLIHHDMHCHICWQRLIRVWRADAPYAAREENDTLAGKDPIQPEECDALQSFIKKEVDRRASEFDRRKADEMVRFRTKTILKAIVAPFLGFPVPLGLLLDRKNASGISDASAMETSMLYNKSWDNTMRRGHVAHILVESLGWGALAITRKSHFAILGNETLSRILPILKRNHPTLRDFLDTVYRVFLFPLLSGKQLLMSDVGRFIHLQNTKTMIAVCREDPNGLKGLFVSHDAIPLPQDPRRSIGGSGGAGNNISAPIALEEPELDYDPDGDAIKSDGEIFTLDQLLSENPVDGEGLDTRVDEGTNMEPQQQDTPLTPISSSRGTKRGNATGPNTPSKRLR
ncbi:MAG: hypothetical protein Q9167_003165 [Letrouitia subvulpina]